MEQFWVWYNDQIALISEHDIETDFCELCILIKNVHTFYDKTCWRLNDTTEIVSLSDTADCTEHTIHEVREGVFVVDDGDEDYSPSSESSSSTEDDDEYESESQLEEEEY